MSGICPYPGLRPFTEDESIYFKGRDTHIEQVIAQLEEKKFLMLTGASGDGKSSLVYAGVIPNARAGFFKANFNNWVVADFKPERAPLAHLANSVAHKLAIDAETAEKELSFGFSSLVNLYKASPYYLDQESEKWKNADENEKKVLKRKAANLLILADQFEEFFTNPENYSRGVPSKESQIVVNLLLETAKMALEQKLPIYIICTMRSDYIGQCAAFRGLPEMIGFSQFFVPRLKRKEIQQVITDPALLSGNKISSRLTETLINEMSEGFDQLPVLQHTLNALWNVADKGNEEMDLLQLAKLAGISPSYLPKEDKTKFDQWFRSVPEFKKEYFKDFSLEQALSSHADILFKTAHEQYAQQQPSGEPLSAEEAQIIIKTAFQCLTKIDEGRAVRNRMTLQEITDVLNEPRYTTRVVGAVLNIFRIQGNTFISPFITDDPASHELRPDTVLDITHESLIRNWGRLTQWAADENENWLTFQDFAKQLKRWTDNNRSSGYLLPIGSLTYFENWFITTKPNKYWLARYDESARSQEEKLHDAERTLSDADQFVKKSARNLFFSRTVLKYGANRILVTIGLVLLVLSCTYYYFDYRSKQNDSILSDIEERGIELLTSSKVDDKIKADFLIEYNRLHCNSGADNHAFADVLNELNDDTLAFDIATRMFDRCQNFDTRASTGDVLNPLIFPLVYYIEGRVDNLTNQQRAQHNNPSAEKDSSTSATATDLTRINKFLTQCAYVSSHWNKDADKAESLYLYQKQIPKNLGSIKQLIAKHTWALDKVLHSMLDADSLVISRKELTNSIFLLLALAPKTDFAYYLERLSPFENEKAATKFKRLYINSTSRTFIGYQLMACLYASDSTFYEQSKMQQCLDSILVISPSYFSNNGHTPMPNVFHPFADLVLTMAHYHTYTNERLEGLLTKAINNADLLDNVQVLLDHAMVKQIDFSRYEEVGVHSYFIGNFCSKEEIDPIWNYFADVLERVQRDGSLPAYVWQTDGKNSDVGTRTVNYNIDDINYQTAVYYKRRGTYCADVHAAYKEANTYFAWALEYFAKIAPWAQEEFESSGYMLENIQPSHFPRSFVFLYPKVVNDFGTDQHNADHSFYYTTYEPLKTMPGQSASTAFLNYVISTRGRAFYANARGVNALETYCYYHMENILAQDSSVLACFSLLSKILDETPALQKSVNFNFITAIRIIQAFSDADTATAFKLTANVDLLKMNKALGNEPDAEKRYVYDHLMKVLSIRLAQHNRYTESFKLLAGKNFYRDALANIAYQLYDFGPDENIPLYLDSAFTKFDMSRDPEAGAKLIGAVAMLGTGRAFSFAQSTVKDAPDRVKSACLLNLVRGIAYNDYYYEAIQRISPDLSSGLELNLYHEIMQREAEKKEEAHQLNIIRTKKIQVERTRIEQQIKWVLNTKAPTGWVEYDKRNKMRLKYGNLD